MDRKSLTNKLNWFYGLEVDQVGLYLEQSRSCQNPLLAGLLEHVANIESGHVLRIGAYMRGIGEEPTEPGGVVASILGRAAGHVSGWGGPDAFLRLDITLEEKAMADYKGLLERVDEPRLESLLWDHLIDEDLHTAWFAEFVAGRLTGGGIPRSRSGPAGEHEGYTRRLVRVLKRQRRAYERNSRFSRDHYIAHAFGRMAGHQGLFEAQLGQILPRPFRGGRLRATVRPSSPGFGRRPEDLLRRAIGAQRHQNDYFRELLEEDSVGGFTAKVVESSWYHGETQRVWMERKLRDLRRG